MGFCKLVLSKISNVGYPNGKIAVVAIVVWVCEMVPFYYLPQLASSLEIVMLFFFLFVPILLWVLRSTSDAATVCGSTGWLTG